MKKKQWVLGFLSILFCLAAVMGAPSQAKAAQNDPYRAVFDADYYYSAYPDLAAAYGRNESALFSHFVAYGIKEGRSGNAEFNLQAYKQRYEDLRNAFGADDAAYCRHYVSFGKSEGRNARADGQITVSVGAAEGNADNKAGQTEKQAANQNEGQNVIGTCTTYYEAGVPRATNVKLAAQRVNGVVVQPGGSFSFSSTVLPRTSANGYVNAPIFISGKHGTGIGGGICQVSSTLYAAMVSAGLPATERHAHSLPVDYLPQGLDATIAGNSLDLKFNNTFSQPLLIQASADGGVLTVTLILQP